MNESRRPARRSEKKSDPKALLRFVEELSWLLSNHSDLDFKALRGLTDELYMSFRVSSNLRSHSAARAPTTQLLVGVLPSLLTDERLFQSNEDIIEFSALTLGISVPRWQKKSKFEVIGHIVCSTDQAEPYRLQRLVRALEDLVDDKGEKRQSLAAQRKSGLSWNEVIQQLLDSPK